MPLSGTLLSPSRVGDVNRSRVLQAFCDHGPLSRADLARMAGVTRATIGNIVQGLIDAGLIEQWEPRSGTGKVGKPARPLWFAPRAGLSGAVAVEVGKAEVALVNARGEILDYVEVGFDTRGADWQDVETAVGAGLREVLPAKRSEVLGIGIAVPGVCDTSTGTILGSGQLPGLRGDGLTKALERRMKVRVLVDNDARAQALGEKWFGEGRGQSTFASIQTGHGLGVGLVLGGVVYRGEHGEVGELGHTCVVVGGDTCRCGLRGCWETIATLRWLRAEAARRRIRGANNLDAKRLAGAAATGDKPAAALLADYADNLAVGLANLAQLLDPQRLILHGDVVGGGEALRSLIEERTRARVLGHLRDRLQVALSSLDQQAGLLGAAGLVLSETFSLAT